MALPPILPAPKAPALPPILPAPRKAPPSIASTIGKIAAGAGAAATKAAHSAPARKQAAAIPAPKSVAPPISRAVSKIATGAGKAATKAASSPSARGQAAGIDASQGTKAVGHSLDGLLAMLKGPTVHEPSLVGARIANAGVPLPENLISHTGDVRSTLEKILGNTGKDLVNLPGSTLTGAEGLGSAAFDDLIHGRLGTQNYSLSGPSETVKLLKGAWHASPEGHLARGDFSGALKAAEAHPLYAAADAAGGLGLVGRGLGAIGRSGALGHGLADVASTERAARELTPGLPGDVQHWSKNVLAKGVQKQLENHPQLQEALRSMTGNSSAHQLRKRVDEFAATSKAATEHAVHDTAQALKAAKPKGAAADVVAHAVMGTGGAPTDFEAGLQARLADLEHAQETKMTPQMARTNLQHQQNIKDFLAHPDTQATFASARDYVARQQELEKQLQDHGLLNSAQAERRALEPYALTQMPGAQYLEKGVLSPRHEAYKAAQKDLATARKEYQDAQVSTVKLTNKHTDAERQVAAAERAMAQASKHEARTAGVLTGRHGTTTSLPPGAAVRMNRALDSTSNTAANLRMMKIGMKSDKAERSALAKNIIAAKKDTVNDAMAHVQALKPFRGDRVKGLVHTDENGVTLPLSNEAIKQHMAERGVDPTAYIRMTAPSDGVKNIAANYRLSRGGGRVPKFTGKGLKSGAWQPGYEALGRSQLNSVRKLMQAKNHDAFVTQSAIRDASGAPRYFNDHNWQQFADEYHQQHGVALEPLLAHPKALDAATIDRIHGIQDPGKAATASAVEHFNARSVSPDEHTGGNIVMVPKVMADRYREHLSTGLGGSQVIRGINRQFRNTVLPLSPKWFAGNMIEGGLRAGLVGAGPHTSHLAGQVIDRMHELGLGEEAAHLQRMSTGGLHMGMQERMNMEELGAASRNPNAVTVLRNAPGVKQFTDGYQHFAEGVFKLNRVAESGLEKSVLGVHMRQQIQEMAGSWGKAVTAQKQYIDALAKGYADPQMAADAGRYVHDTLGQYDRFSPLTKKWIATVAPFGPWYLNAAKFVYHTLPVHHPITQAVLLDVYREVANNWTQDHGVPHGSFMGQPAGDLLSSLKTGPGSFVNLGRFMPEGAFTSGPVDYASSSILPQFQGAWHALSGQDPFGNALADKNGKVTDSGQMAGVAINSVLSELAGPVNVLSRIIAQHGDTPYNASTLWKTELKPNTHHGPAGVLGGIERVLNPFEPTHLIPQSQATAQAGVVTGKGSVVSLPGSVVTAKGNVVTLPGNASHLIAPPPTSRPLGSGPAGNPTHLIAPAPSR